MFSFSAQTNFSNYSTDRIILELRFLTCCFYVITSIFLSTILVNKDEYNIDILNDQKF